MKVKRFICLTTSIVIALLIHNAILKSFVILHYDIRDCEWLYDYNDCMFETMAKFSRQTTVLKLHSSIVAHCTASKPEFINELEKRGTHFYAIRQTITTTWCNIVILSSTHGHVLRSVFKSAFSNCAVSVNIPLPQSLDRLELLPRESKKKGVYIPKSMEYVEEELDLKGFVDLLYVDFTGASSSDMPSSFFPLGVVGRTGNQPIICQVNVAFDTSMEHGRLSVMLHQLARERRFVIAGFKKKPNDRDEFLLFLVNTFDAECKRRFLSGLC